MKRYDIIKVGYVYRSSQNGLVIDTGGYHLVLSWVAIAE